MPQFSQADQDFHQRLRQRARETAPMSDVQGSERGANGVDNIAGLSGIGGYDACASSVCEGAPIASNFISELRQRRAGKHHLTAGELR
jgi:hypothetical protein